MVIQMHDHDEYIKADSILLSVKKLVGIPEEEHTFDVDLVLYINAALSILFQLGVLKVPYTVDSEDDLYASMLPGVGEDVINQVKMYLVYKVKLGFDSSTLSSTMIDVLKEEIKEAEWRLMVSFNPSDTFE